MKTKTVDAIVREKLNEYQLPAHKYHFFLQHCLKEMQSLALNHKMGASQIELPVNGYMRAAVPDTAIRVLDVSIKQGERLLPASKDKSLNKLYNFDGAGNKIAHPEPGDEETSTINFLTDFYRDGEIYGISGYFGLSAPRDRQFTLDWTNKEIVFSNQFDKDVVVITYITDPVSTSSANLVTYDYIDVLKAKMDWEYKKINKRAFNVYDVRDAKQEYHNQKRVMRARIYSMTFADLIYNIRRGLHAAPKS